MKLVKIAAVLMLTAITLSAVPAFPGAEGWGKNATGGRDGRIVRVTSLASSGTGTLRAACGINGAKIIVFDTAGVIDCGNSPIFVTSNTYIAGQTAPGGITLKNGGLYINNHSNIIIRFIRVRRSASAADGDCFRAVGTSTSNIVFDHCSGYWASDEVLDVGSGAYNVTIQSSVMAEPLMCSEFYGSGPGYGNNRTAIFSAGNDGRITFYKLVQTHAMKRTPFCSNRNLYNNVGKTYEFINCLTYNCSQASAESFDEGNTVPLNLVGNYYKGGPSFSYGGNPYHHSGTITPKSMRVHASGNFHVKYPTITNPAAFFNGQSIITPFVDTMIHPVMTTNILPAQTAYWECLASSGVVPRDSTEKQTFKEIIDSTGIWQDDCYPPTMPFMSATGSVPRDTDRDGMPDAWETSKGLNPNDSTDRRTNMGGYNALEVYLNELADSLVAEASLSFEKARPFMKGLAPEVVAMPNPFNPVVKFTLCNMSSKPVVMTVYDVNGRQVYRSGLLVDHSNLVWNSRDIYGKAVGTGTYLVKFVQGNLSVQRQITLIR